MDRDQLIAEIRKQLQEEMKAYKQSLSAQIPDEQKKQFNDVKDTVTTQIKEHPLAATGLAILAGFVLARMIYKRSND